MKRQATMASTPSKDDVAIPTLKAFGVEVARRRAAVGEPQLPRNTGERRTPSKRALLKAIEDAGGRW
jgi:hypothetical protein